MPRRHAPAEDAADRDKDEGDALDAAAAVDDPPTGALAADAAALVGAGTTARNANRRQHARTLRTASRNSTYEGHPPDTSFPAPPNLRSVTPPPSPGSSAAARASGRLRAAAVQGPPRDPKA